MGEVDRGKTMKMVRVIDIEKRRVPSKHYVFVLEITWNDQTQNIIYRRYSQFFTLQTSLIDAFPIEGGVKNPAERILPFLPGKVLFRSQVREVALKRKGALDEYCRNLVKLPEKILNCEHITSFFQASLDDVSNLTDSLTRDGSVKIKDKKKADVISDPVLLEQWIALSDFQKCGKGQISLVAGDLVEVIEKSENGWFFVSSVDEQGWVPCSYLEPVDGKSEENAVTKCLTEEKFVCVKAYKKSLDDEIDLELGAIVDVIQKGSDGWWEVRFKGQPGWVPRAHLKSAVHLDLSKQTLSVGIVKDRESLRNAGILKVSAPPRRRTVKRVALYRSTDIDALDGGKKPLSHTVSESEYVAISDYQVSIGDKKMHVSGGQSYTVIEMAPNGWSLIKVGDEEAWVPSDVLNRRRKKDVMFEEDGDDIYQNVKSLSPVEDIENANNEINNNKCTEHESDEDCFVTIGAYAANDPSEISFDGNVGVTVVEKNETGWWYVKTTTDEGWAPSTYLKPDSKKMARNRLVQTGSDKQREIIEISLGPPKPNRKSQVPQSYENVGADEKKGDKPSPAPKVPPIAKPRSGSKASLDGSTSSPKDELALAFAARRASPSLLKAISIDTAKTSPLPAPRKISEPAKRPPRPEKSPSPINIRGKVTPPPASNKPAVPKLRSTPSPQSKASRASPVIPARPSPMKTELYETICEYCDDDDGMLSFKAGEKVHVLEKDDGGWWLGMIGVRKGWVPSNFLKKSLAF